MHISPPPYTLVAKGAVLYQVAVLLLIYCVPPIVCGVLCWHALLYVLTKFAIILTRKRELLALRSDVLLL